MSKEKKLSYALSTVLLIAGYFLFTGLINGKILNNHQTGIAVFICINIILAVSLNITVGCLGQIR